MRIAHVITKGDVGGAQTHVVELAAAQRRRGDDVVVLAGCDGSAMDRARDHDVEVRIVRSLARSLRPTADVLAVGEIRADLREICPDVVHTHSSKGGLLGRIAARRERLPVVYTAHGFPFQSGAPVAQRVSSLLGECVGGHLGDAVICLTESEADLARRWRIAPRASIIVVPNGLPDTTQVRLPGPRPVPQLLMVARFAPPKRQAELIEALSGLLDVPWTIRFVGDGPQLPACRELGARILGDRVEFLGHRDDVLELTAASDVALLWSGYEGMPISLMEAMRAGLCCLASDLPGVRVLFGDDGGVVVADREQLRAALRGLLASAGQIDELGARARARYESTFSMDLMVHRIDAVYERVRHRS